MSPAPRQEFQELPAFAKPPPHDFPVSDHVARQRQELAGAEVKPPVEPGNGLEDLGVRKTGIPERALLRAVLSHQRVAHEPALLYGLAIQRRAGIRRG